jgi:hypothetical protein
LNHDERQTAQQGARANDHGCHDPCSEQHGSRQPRSWLILDVSQKMKSIIFLLVAIGVTACARKDAAVSPRGSRAVEDDKANAPYARKADAILAKHGEPGSSEITSSILTERAMGEVSKRIPAAKDKTARILFEGERHAIVTISYTLPQSSTPQRQTVQFFFWQREWEMKWIEPAQQN